MSESLQHQQLVTLLLEKITGIVGTDNTSLIATDAVDGADLPPLTKEGFRPDVYYSYNDLLIIGEAKTSSDVNRLHSIEQYKSYIKKCSLFNGKAVLLIAVPWMDHAAAHNTIRKITKQFPGTYSVIILDGIGGAI